MLPIVSCVDLDSRACNYGPVFRMNRGLRECTAHTDVEFRLLYLYRCQWNIHETIIILWINPAINFCVESKNHL